MAGEHPDFANVSVGAKHSGCKSLALTNNLSTGMLRPYKIGMLPMAALQELLEMPIRNNCQKVEYIEAKFMQRLTHAYY